MMNKNNGNDNDDEDNNNKKSIPPPPEQSGYYILDVRETESFLEGPWLEIIPKSTTTTTTTTNEEEQQETKKSTKRRARCKTCHVPLSELRARCFELPAKRTNIILIHDSDQNEDEVREILCGDWNIVDEFRMVGARNTQCITTFEYVEDASWLCKPFQSEIDAFLKEEAKNRNNPKYLPTLHRHRILNSSSSSVHFLPLRPDDLRAWSPSPFLEQHLDSIIIPQLRLNDHKNDKNNSAKIAVDIGSGNGRDIAFLATRGVFDTCFAIDNRHHLLQNSLQLARRYSAAALSSASYHAVACTVTTSLPLREEVADLIICVRFLERPLLTGLARHLRVGGFLLYSHFVDGVQNSAVGQPKSAKHYVMHGELKKKIVDDAVLPKRIHQHHHQIDGDDASVLLAKLWNIQVLIDEEVLLEDGRPVNNLLIRRVC